MPKVKRIGLSSFFSLSLLFSLLLSFTHLSLFLFPLYFGTENAELNGHSWGPIWGPQCWITYEYVRYTFSLGTLEAVEKGCLNAIYFFGVSCHFRSSVSLSSKLTIFRRLFQFYVAKHSCRLESHSHSHEITFFLSLQRWPRNGRRCSQALRLMLVFVLADGQLVRERIIRASHRNTPKFWGFRYSKFGFKS